jgi:hypothetical protein
MGTMNLAGFYNMSVFETQFVAIVDVIHVNLTRFDM